MDVMNSLNMATFKQYGSILYAMAQDNRGSPKVYVALGLVGMASFVLAFIPKRTPLLKSKSEVTFRGIDKFGNELVKNDGESSSSDDDDDTEAASVSTIAAEEEKMGESIARDKEKEKAELALPYLWLPLPLQKDRKPFKSMYMPRAHYQSPLTLSVAGFSYDGGGSPLYRVECTWLESRYGGPNETDISYETIRAFRDGLISENSVSMSGDNDGTEGKDKWEAELTPEQEQQREVLEALQLIEEMSPFPAPITYTFYLTEDLVVDEKRRLDSYLRRMCSNQRFLRSKPDMQQRVVAALFGKEE